MIFGPGGSCIEDRGIGIGFLNIAVTEWVVCTYIHTWERPNSDLHSHVASIIRIVEMRYH